MEINFVEIMKKLESLDKEINVVDYNIKKIRTDLNSCIWALIEFEKKKHFKNQSKAQER